MSTIRTPGALARIARTWSGVIGRSNSRFKLSLCARGMGTRTHVAEIMILGSAKIFRVSPTILFSSSLYPLAAMAVLWLNTLLAIWCGNFSFTIGWPAAYALTCCSSS